MSYVGNTPEEQKQMLSEIGVNSFEELLDVIPDTLRVDGLLDLPEPVSEIEMQALAAALNKKNRSVTDTISFLGGGAYDHYIPTIVDFLIFRSEFYTAYTPYQPEVSQGTLQAMYEYQSMICELTGMDVSNASLYDGGSGLGEAALMCVRVSDFPEILIAETVNPHYRQIVETYCRNQDITVETVPMKEGRLDSQALRNAVHEQIGGVIVQSPNFFGVIEDLEHIKDITRKQAPDALFTVSANPVALGILKPPAEFDADIVVAEGQALGNHQSFGGPYLGVFALKEDLVRKMPGRLVGATVDVEDNRAFVLVMKTREQDIRREKATSNICTNQGLNALAATVYMSSLGKQGIQKVSELCAQKAHYLAEKLNAIDDVSVAFQQPYFNEFVIDLPIPAKEVIHELLEADLFAGVDLGSLYDGHKNKLLVAVTEKRTKSDLDNYVTALSNVLSSASSPV